MPASHLSRKASAVAVGVALLIPGLGATTGAEADQSPHGAPNAVAGARSQTQVDLTRMGSVNLGALARTAARSQRLAPATANPRTEIGPKPPGDDAEASLVARVAPDPATTRLDSRPNESLHFEGLNIRDSRYANNGNQFTSEPPDQALCVGNGYTLEGVNTALAVYDRTGGQLAAAVSIAEFFGFAPEFNRDKGTFGPSVFDPVCLYDQEVDRFFFLVTELDVEPISGNFTGGSHLYFAVSQTGDPLGDYTRYVITTTNGDDTDRRCPCFDDFPHIGADANGFYISANRFPIFVNGFNGAQIYAISKRGLAANAVGAPRTPTVVSLNAGRIDGDPSFTVQPAAVPPGGSYTGNREYFLSTTDFDTRRESKIGVWALSNTDSLDDQDPAVRLSRRTIPSLTYALEPNAEQKQGAANPLGESVDEPLNALDSGSDMSEVEYAGGRLWGAIGTAVGGSGDKRDGVLWVQVRPSFTNGRADGTVVEQGYVALRTNNLMYPAIGVNAAGTGAMVMSVAGPTVFPTPSYIPIDRNGVTGPVRVNEFGARPDDGFTCYAAFVGSRDRGCRWGDYSAATADEWGGIWMATEYISSGPRVPFANWSTEVFRYRPRS